MAESCPSKIEAVVRLKYIVVIQEIMPIEQVLKKLMNIVPSSESLMEEVDEYGNPLITNIL
jgi:hypothetical protein